MALTQGLLWQLISPHISSRLPKRMAWYYESHPREVKPAFYDVILCYTMLYCISLRLGFCDPYHLDVAATVRHLKTSILKEFLDDVWHPGWSWTLWGCSAVVAREIYRWSAQPTTAGVELMMRHDAWWISLNLNFRNLNACLWSFMIHDVSSHSSLGLGQKLPQDIRFKHFQIFQTGV